MSAKPARRRLLIALLRLAATVAVSYGFILMIPRLAAMGPDAPDPDELGPALAPPTWSAPASTTPPPPLPPGFPSMQFPPPKIDVEPGEPQPIATKFGLTYDIPPDWDNEWSAVFGWSDDDGLIAGYGAHGQYGYEYCDAVDGATLAVTGATGRRGIDIETAALDEVRLAERIFADDDRMPKVTYTEAQRFTIAGNPAVRYTALVDDVPKSNECDPPRARFDVVATRGFATAEVMVLVVEAHQGLPGAIEAETIDQIIGTLRPS
ncbi:hypothetical protein [Rhodococcus spongiicola]|nr:hypothetical protein [Rhodococcus spongiicola]